MSDVDKSEKELGENIDFKVGVERVENRSSLAEMSYFEEEILKALKEQTEHLKQIKYFICYFFCVSIIAILLGLLK
jgi:hypothetical protein